VVAVHFQQPLKCVVWVGDDDNMMNYTTCTSSRFGPESGPDDSGMFFWEMCFFGEMCGSYCSAAVTQRPKPEQHVLWLALHRPHNMPQQAAAVLGNISEEQPQCQ
jgi:hypothetical protein